MLRFEYETRRDSSLRDITSIYVAIFQERKASSGSHDISEPLANAPSNLVVDHSVCIGTALSAFIAAFQVPLWEEVPIVMISILARDDCAAVVCI